MADVHLSTTTQITYRLQISKEELIRALNTALGGCPEIPQTAEVGIEAKPYCDDDVSLVDNITPLVITWTVTTEQG